MKGLLLLGYSVCCGAFAVGMMWHLTGTVFDPGGVGNRVLRTATIAVWGW